MNKLLIKPNQATFAKAQEVIGLFDQAKGIMKSSPAMVSKLAKNIKTIQPAIPRFFESPNQISSYFAEGEYDLTSLFKLMKHEAYFMKAVQKKLSLLMKSGVGIKSENDEMTKYMEARFMMMQLQTGISLTHLVKQISMYLLVCSNAWVVKVRDKDCEVAHSYDLDGKEQAPVVGLFIPHPTTIKPRFKYKQKGKYYEMVLDKWIYLSVRRGIVKEFEPEDVVHFTLYKEDGMVFGTPDVLPVVDDIRTLRKIEEDVQLLIYRDLFPILHYKVENPSMVDHVMQTSELDKAKQDLQSILQDGGIATDARHTIEYVGNSSKGLDAKDYLKYFQERVFSGLGVSATDMGMGNEISGNTANSMSKSLTDIVRFIQQEIAEQFSEKILLEFALQSPIENSLYPENLPKLVFTEIDLEWQIRKENHHADLFQKNVIDVNEARKAMGREDFTEENFNQTHHGLYEKPAQDAEIDLAHKQVEVGAAKTITQIKHKASTARKKDPMKRSAADRDSIKAAKSNSNIVKSQRDSLDIEESISLQDEFRAIMDKVDHANDARKRMDIIMASKCTYDKIKANMLDKIHDGMEAAAKDLELTDYEDKVMHNIFAPLDKIRDEVVDSIYKDSTNLNRATARVATANRTEQNRAYNYGYALTCVNNNHNKFIIYSDFNDVAADSSEYLGKELTLNLRNIVQEIPPFRPNSRLKIRVITETEA
jgi:hypothetical protein